MPGVGSQVIDVALGLLFVYLVFSLVCTALQELVATVLSWRAEFLEKGIRRLLSGAKDAGGEDVLAKLLANPRVAELVPPKRALRRTRRLPSYLTAPTFSLALLDTLVPPPAGEPSLDLLARARTAIGELPASDFKRELSSMASAAGDDLAKLRSEMESWYDETMNRVSGWYKRKAHLWLLIFGFLVAAVGNVDTIHVVDRLWNDPTTRAAVVAQAQKAATADDTAALEKLASTYEGVKGLQLPVGWTTPSDDEAAVADPRAFPDSIDGMKVLGLILTALALSFGAPFWFDALSKLGRLRATAKPEGATPKGSST
jgi:hypothetical protein